MTGERIYGWLCLGCFAAMIALDIVLPPGLPSTTSIFGLLALACVFAWLGLSAGRQFQRPGACGHCGYDLGELARCPECGHPRR